MIGIIGRKLGMTQIFNEAGQQVPVTVVEADSKPAAEAVTFVHLERYTRRPVRERREHGFGPPVMADQRRRPRAGSCTRTGS